MADLGDAGEILRYTVGFWAFLFHRGYRNRTLRRWRDAGAGARGLMVLEGVVTTLIGLGLPLLLGWILVGALKQG